MGLDSFTTTIGYHTAGVFQTILNMCRDITNFNFSNQKSADKIQHGHVHNQNTSLNIKDQVIIIFITLFQALLVR